MFCRKQHLGWGKKKIFLCFEVSAHIGMVFLTVLFYGVEVNDNHVLRMQNSTVY